MTCEEIRRALSARLDGEEAPTDPPVDVHLAGCEDCRQWLASAELLHRRMRLAPAPDVPDLTERVMTAVAADNAVRTGPTPLVPRFALGCIAAVQLAMSGPLLLLGHDHTAPIHVAHEVGAFDAALGLGLLLAAIRPSLAAGMTPLVGVITTLLLVTATSDVAGGRTGLADEAPHAWDAVGFLLLAYVAGLTGRNTTRKWRRA
jgi:predicted anti-sigma-YlaC factor YlaD